MEKLLLEKYGPLMDIEELAILLRIKRQSVYQQIYRGQLDLPHIKRGKKYLFPTQGVAQYFTDQLGLQPAS
jgi:excisionase family DNA binding protein